jgi:hypothetical protein
MFKIGFFPYGTPTPPSCPNIGDVWHGGTVFYISGNDYYVASSVNFDNGNFAACSNPGYMGTQTAVTDSYNNTVLLSNGPCGPGNLAFEVLLPITENGYNDWFIPSLRAMESMYDLGLLNPQIYWTSTESNATQMITFDGTSGINQLENKGNTGPWAILIRKETCI